MEPCLRLSCEALLASCSLLSDCEGGARGGEGIGVGADDGSVACACNCAGSAGDDDGDGVGVGGKCAGDGPSDEVLVKASLWPALLFMR